MREIKFRAWWKKANRMLDVVKIWWWKGKPTHISLQLKGHQTENGENERILEREKNWFELMQYTGLKDKKGVEIYEGDIITATLSSHNLPTMGEIVYYQEFGAFANKNKGGRTLLHSMCLNSFEVIGNVWKNPELLKELIK